MRLSKPNRPNHLLLAVSLVAATAGSAGADPVTFQFSGVVTKVDPGAGFLVGLSVGQTYTATLVYDTDVPDLDPSQGGGFYLYNNSSTPPLGPPLGFNIQFSGGTTVAPDYTSAVTATVADDSTTTTVASTVDYVFLDQRPLFDGASAPASTRMYVFLADSTHSVFDSGALPTGIDLADFTHGIVLIPNGFDSFFEASIDGVAIVPEPSAMALTAAGGLLGIVALRRRGRSPA